MIIAIDGYEANTAHRVGIGEYAYNILKSLYALSAASNMPHTFRIYLPSVPRDDMPNETSWWTYHIEPLGKLWTFIGLPFALMRDQPAADVVFSPTHYIPRFIPHKRVMSIMDLSYLHYPELFRKKDLHQLVHWTAYSADHAKKILTISEFSRDAIIKAYAKDPERVSVTYPGLNLAKTDSSMTLKQLQDRYDISRHYILSVGTLQPRKNYDRLIAAFALFLQKNKQKFSHLQLVIVGKPGWLYEDILKSPSVHGVQDRVKFLQFVPDDHLGPLYKHALCFALPSLYEGFGLPVLEAMAHQCPVVISDVSSLPEIAGKAGVYVDPMDHEDIARGLLKVVRERNLKQGTHRIKIGSERVKEFTWQRAAQQTLEALEEVGRG